MVSINRILYAHQHSPQISEVTDNLLKTNQKFYTLCFDQCTTTYLWSIYCYTLDAEGSISEDQDWLFKWNSVLDVAESRRSPKTLMLSNKNFVVLLHSHTRNQVEMIIHSSFIENYENFFVVKSNFILEESQHSNLL